MSFVFVAASIGASIEHRSRTPIKGRILTVFEPKAVPPYRDANRVKFSLDRLLGNVEPKTFCILFSPLFRLPSVCSALWLARPTARFASRPSSDPLLLASLGLPSFPSFQACNTNIGLATRIRGLFRSGKLLLFPRRCFNLAIYPVSFVY